MHTVSCEINGKKLTIETGKIARQAHGSALVRYGDTIVLVTAVSEYRAVEGKDFLPLTVEYREKAYATGKIPGGFFKREGRPTTKETLVSRLIDRPLRPLFPKGYANETQVLATVLSADKENDADVLSIIGASAALSISDIPFGGPIAGVRVGRIEGKLIVNPIAAQVQESDLDLVVAASRDAIIMVEGGCRQLAEADLLDAIYFGHEAIKKILDAQDELIKQAGKPKRAAKAPEDMSALKAKIWATARDNFAAALRTSGKIERHTAMDKVREDAIAALDAEFPDQKPKMYALFESLEKELLREGIINSQRRVDGRGLADIRKIESEVAALPQVHGSALFTRGETQALAVVTLGTRQDEQKIESLEGEYWKSFLLHYNFPPFSVGEVGRRMGPGRREIGHGNLAERAIEKVIPPHDEFPYTVRCVSEVLESNGSSSMATVCATSLALMDAGIPTTAPVAGIAMGLVKEGDKFFILSDILGDEDHCGDMDFKVAGTKDGVTAFQMDMKIGGITREIMAAALKQANQGRLHILDRMNSTLDKHRPEMSPTAPRIEALKIPVDKIKDLIGPGGKMIKKIIEETGANIDVEDDGTVMVSSLNGAANKKAIEWIENITAEAEVGKFYKGRVVKIMEFGAFVEIIPGTDGLIHVSQLDFHRVNQVTDVLHEGDIVIVKCIGVDPNGKISLSRKEALGKDENGNPIEGYVPPPPPPRSPDGGGEPRQDRGGDGGRGRRDRNGGGGRGRY